MSVGRISGAPMRVHGEALPLVVQDRNAASGAMEAARAARRRVREAAGDGFRSGPFARVLLAVAMLLGLAVAVPMALTSSAAGADVSTVLGIGGFPIYYEDGNGVRLDPCLDANDPACPLLPSDSFDPLQPMVFPTNFPDEFFYQAVESDRIATPGCVGSAVPEAATPNDAMMIIALEGAFANELPAINDQMVFARIRLRVGGGLCENTTYRFTHPYGSFDMTTDEVGGIKPSPGTTDVGCVPTTQVTCDFRMALTSDMLVNGFLRWSNNEAPAGYLGDGGTLHTIEGGPVSNSFTISDVNDAVIATTDLWTVSGRLAGPIVTDPQLLDFGGVATDAPSTRTITVTNIGADPWSFTGASVSEAGPFTVGGTDCPEAPAALQRDEVCHIDVTFAPAVTGQVGFASPITLDIAHDGLHSPYRVTLRGTGINPGEQAGIVLSAEELDFGRVRLGLLSAPQTLEISNNGFAPLEVTSLTFHGVAGPQDEAFELPFDGCTGVSVPAGGVEHCDVQVAFRPNQVRDYEAILRITANIDGTTREVDLLATGIGGVAAVSKDDNGDVVLDPTNGFPVWYQDELGQRVGQCLDFQDPNCLVLADGFYTGGAVGGLQNGEYVNFPEEFFWYQAESEPVATPGCGGDPGEAFVIIAGEAAFLNGPPVDGDQMSFGRVRISARGLCPFTEYTVVHPYGSYTVTTDDRGRVPRGPGTIDIGCVPPAGESCNWDEALASPVFGGFIRQVNAPAGYLGDPNAFDTVTGAPFVADREIAEAGDGEEPAAANYFRIFQTSDPNAYNAETDRFSVMGKLAGPLTAIPGTLVYEQTGVGSASDAQTVTLRNEGLASVDIESAVVTGLPDDYTITDDQCTGETLAADGECTLTVVFEPSATGVRSAQITVVHTGDNSPMRVALSGIGGAPTNLPAFSVSPTSLGFVDLHVDEVSASTPLTVSNVGGNAPLTVGTVTVEGGDVADFEVDASDCAAPVAIDGTCELLVRFTPTADGMRAATVRIAHDAGFVGDGLVQVSGRGFDGTSDVSGTVIDAGFFPDWFQDNNGVRIEACLTQGDPGCILLPEGGYDPSLPTVFPTNFPPEFFWYMAETDPTFSVTDPRCGATGTIGIRIAVEGTFLNDIPVDGDQVMFNRVRISGSDLCPDLTYEFVHPYGTTQATADDRGRLVFTDDLEDIGGMVPSRPLGSSPAASGGGLLRWDPSVAPAAPAGYLGDAVSFHPVVGSTYRPDGPGSEPVNHFEVFAFNGALAPTSLGRTDGFMVAGKLAAPVVADVEAVAFGDVARGDAADATITISNLDTAAITVQSLTLSGSTAFSVTGGTCGSGVVLDPDATCTVVVDLAPTGGDPLAAVAATLTVDHTGPRTPVIVALSGTVTEAGNPQIAYTPASINFGTQSAGVAGVPVVVTITNTGTGAAPGSDLVISAIDEGVTNAGQFTSTTNCLAAPVAVGDSCTLSIAFAPTSGGTKSGQFTIHSNDPASPSVFVTVSGTAVAPAVTASPTALTIEGKKPVTKTIVLTNSGTAPFNVVGVPSITGPDAVRFTAVVNQCTNVAPGRNCKIDVTFRPPNNVTRGQQFAATLTIASNAANSPTIVTLTGVGK